MERVSQAHHDQDNLEISKHNPWVKYENYKKTLKFLNDKIKKNGNLKEEHQDVVELCQEIECLRKTLSKFLGSTENLDKLLRYNRILSIKSKYGYEGNTYVHDKEKTICYFYGKAGHMMSKCRNLPKTRSSDAFKTNKKGLKRIQVPKEKIIPIANIFDH